MPTVGTFHTQYWAITGGAAPPAGGTADKPMYPPWQVVVIVKSGGG